MRHIAVDAADVTIARTDQYSVIAQWCIELDAHGSLKREVGLSLGGVPIYRAPIGNDRGLFCDSNVTFGSDWTTAISPAEFEALWSRASEHSSNVA